MAGKPPPDPFAPARLGPVRLRNRIIKAATFEGMSPRGLVTDALVEFHRRVAAGGVAMTTLAYCAVSREGRSAPGEIVMREEAIPGLRRLTEAVHHHGAAACAQLGHSGPVAGAGGRGLAPSRVFSPLAMRWTRAATEDDVAGVVSDFARAARIAAASGFDAIELHLGHGYLPSAFLSPRLNRRRDRWGGGVENRARLARAIATAAREAVGGDVAVTAKLNMLDGVRGGLAPEESIAVAQMLEDDGALDAIELTGGSSFQNPMFLFRGDVPIREMAAAMPPLLGAGMRLLGRRFLRAYPFEEAYFLPVARRFRAALRMPLVLLGGVTRLETIHAAMAEGFELVAMARALLREPDLVRRMAQGSASEGTCVHCNRCMPSIYSGTRCVLDEPEPPAVSLSPSA